MRRVTSRQADPAPQPLEQGAEVLGGRRFDLLDPFRLAGLLLVNVAHDGLLPPVGGALRASSLRFLVN